MDAPAASELSPSAHPDAIDVVGARTNNLKNIHCRVPLGRLTVVTGVSGSGKSSLAFDTLYSEGQRRFIESMSTYARQFLEKMRRPDVDFIHNLPPAIAIEQKNSVKNARSTIGTATEIHDYLRLLFSKIGRTFCPECQIEVRRDTPESSALALLDSGAGQRFTLVAPVRIEKRTNFEAVIREMIGAGFSRAWTREGVKDLEEVKLADRSGDKAIYVVVDRIVAREEDLSRISASFQLAFRTGSGEAAAIDSEDHWQRFSSHFACAKCSRTFREPEPLMFSFYSPLGACPRCEGYGRVIDIDWWKAIPNRSLTLDDRPIAAWNTPSNEGMYDHMLETTSRSELPRNKPLCEFDEDEWRVLVEGNGEFIGLKGFFGWYESKKYKVQARVYLARYRDYVTCPECNGMRLRPEALNVKIDDHTIGDLAAMSIEELHRYYLSLRLEPHEEQAVSRVLNELRARLHYLDNVGLGYLTLARQTRTLSGGESQRINLSAALGSVLTETLYVLDEPTVGLHARDTERLLRVMQALRENGNTVVVVEHDPDIISEADHVIDMGPGAGEHGGEIMFEGTPQAMRDTPGCSITARYQKVLEDGKIPSRRRKPTGWITIRGARQHNLKNLTVSIPRGVLCCITGVSGSGKSTLMHETLYGGFKRMRDLAPVDCGEFESIEGLDDVEDLILVDQSLPGRSTRSNPVTYVKAYDSIRDLFGSTREARRAGVTSRDFSFNVDGGRCERCEGTGTEIIDMQFLADVEVVCGLCDGHRFQRRVLDIEYKGLNINGVLDLTVDAALKFFLDQRKIKRCLQPLSDVGLGYIRLGQNTATFSGGEAQRLKLASYLTSSANGSVVFLFDEPTTGLHTADLEKLAAVLQRLVDSGATVLVIEHNLDLIAQADYIIDLGPEGGDAGGEIVAQGTVEKIMGNKKSLTGQWLAKRYKIK